MCPLRSTSDFDQSAFKRSRCCRNSIPSAAIPPHNPLSFRRKSEVLPAGLPWETPSRCRLCHSVPGGNSCQPRFDFLRPLPLWQGSRCDLAVSRLGRLPREFVGLFAAENDVNCLGIEVYWVCQRGSMPVPVLRNPSHNPQKCNDCASGRHPSRRTDPIHRYRSVLTRLPVGYYGWPSALSKIVDGT